MQKRVSDYKSSRILSFWKQMGSNGWLFQTFQQRVHVNSPAITAKSAWQDPVINSSDKEFQCHSESCKHLTCCNRNLLPELREHWKCSAPTRSCSSPRRRHHPGTLKCCLILPRPGTPHGTLGCLLVGRGRINTSVHFHAFVNGNIFEWKVKKHIEPFSLPQI